MKSQILEEKKTKVIHSFPIWLPQTQTWMYNQVRYLTDDIESHIVCEKTDNLDQFWLPNIHSLSEHASKWRYFWDMGLRKLKLRHHLGFLVEVAKSEGVSVLHSHFGPVGWANLGAAKGAKLKHIVTFYGLDVNYLPVHFPYWRKRYQELFTKVDTILCEGPHMAKCVVNLGCPVDKVKVHHLGVSIEKLTFKPRIWNRDQPLRILIAASFREKKGIPDALEALGQLQNDTPLEITIIGDASHENRSQAEKQKILATIERYKLKSKIRLLGYQPYSVLLEEAYKHHIFLSPSLTGSDGDTEGGLPVAIIELAATGMPIVSTKHADIPELIQNNHSGMLASERDVEGLVQNLRWLIYNPDKWHSMTQSCRKNVENKFDANIQGKKLAEIYKNQLMR